MVKRKVVEEVEEEEKEEPTFGDRVRRVLRKIVALLFLVPFVAFLILLAFRTASFAREFTTRQDAAPGTGRFVKAADLELFVQEAGPDTAPVVVLIHGTGAWSEIWRETMTALADRGFRSVAIDLPPFGFSERPEAVAYDNVSQARRILGVLDALALDSVILVGHSFGSRPTMEAAFMAPQRIRRLVLVDAALNVGEGATEPRQSRLTRTVLAIAPLRNALVSATATNPMMTRRLFQKLIHNDAAATDARVDMLQKQFLVKGSTGKLGQWLRWFLAPMERSLASERQRYRTLPMPVLLIWGERDDLTPLSQGEDLATLIPGAQLVVLKNTGHIPAVEDPAAFNAALIQFLEAPR